MPTSTLPKASDFCPSCLMMMEEASIEKYTQRKGKIIKLEATGVKRKSV